MAGKFVDVIIRAYAGSSKLDYFVKGYWKSVMRQQPPVLLDVGHTASGVPGSGSFAAWIKKFRQSHGGEFIRPFIKSKAARFPSGYSVGRIAIVGFSAGCGAVKEILSNAADRELVDFAYFCDGLHSEWNQDAKMGPKGRVSPYKPSQRLVSPEESLPYISDAGLDGVIEFGKKAAAGVGPALVITHSQVVPPYPSTTETALYVQRKIEAAVGSTSPDGGINPVGFLATGGGIPQPPEKDDAGGYWPSSWNNSCPPGNMSSLKVKIRPPWPVSGKYVKGWFVRAGFDAHDSDHPDCDKRTNSQPAHIFQADWVQKEVYRHILSERWKVVCTSGMSGLGTLLIPSAFRREQVKMLSAATVQPTFFGGAVKHSARSLRPVSVPFAGLGAAAVESCYQGGVFSDILGPEEIRQQKLKLAGYAGLAVAAVAGGYMWFKR
jgi:hypothetical protein